MTNSTLDETVWRCWSSGGASSALSEEAVRMFRTRSWSHTPGRDSNFFFSCYSATNYTTMQPSVPEYCDVKFCYVLKPWSVQSAHEILCMHFSPFMYCLPLTLPPSWERAFCFLPVTFVFLEIPAGSFSSLFCSCPLFYFVPHFSSSIMCVRITPSCL